MRFFLMFFLSALVPLQINADGSSQACDELWFSRNAMMDYAGYCFQSPLGQAVFDNSDCTTSEPQLSLAAQAMTRQIIKNEATLACDVNTDRTELEPMWNIAQRRELEVQPPVPNAWEAETSCIGYGATVPIYAAPDHAARILDVMRPGGNINFVRDVLVQDKTYEVFSQLLVDEDGTVLPGYHGEQIEGEYWMFVQTYNANTSDYLREGWVFLPSKPAFWRLCDGAAG